MVTSTYMNLTKRKVLMKEYKDQMHIVEKL